MAEKKFRLTAQEIAPLAEGYGACFATDKIVVDGCPVGYMYREEADDDIDSGWRFTAGVETEEYMSDGENVGVYDVNTIANYDPDIIALLDAPAGSSFARDPSTGELLPVNEDAPADN